MTGIRCAVVVMMLAAASAANVSAQEFIKAPNGTYWKIEVGLRRLFTSAESIEAYGFKTSSAVEVDQEKFDRYPVGDPLPARKIVQRSMKIDAQDTGEVQIPVEGWSIVDGPNVENGSQVEVANVFDGNGSVVALKVTSHNPNAAIMGMGKSRTVTVQVVLEKR